MYFKCFYSICIYHVYLDLWDQIFTRGQTPNPNAGNSSYVWKSFYLKTLYTSYTNWGTGEPNCILGHENCLTYDLQEKISGMMSPQNAIQFVKLCFSLRYSIFWEKKLDLKKWLILLHCIQNTCCKTSFLAFVYFIFKFLIHQINDKNIKHDYIG